jgi:molybdopterin molybdotransferase
MVRIDRGIEEGKHVRPAAEDVKAGQRVLCAGTVITPPVVGVLAGLGVDRLAVQYEPRVFVISTGDEIVDPGAEPFFGQVRNTNGPGLAAQVLLAGGRPVGTGRSFHHVRDDRSSLAGAISDALRQADVVVLSGGVSMGAHDHVQEAMKGAGVECMFWKVRQRPGKPLLYGRSGDRHVFGLPGNPVSAAMGFEMYVRPVLDAMSGRTPVDWSAGQGLFAAVLDEDIRKPEGLYGFMRGVATMHADGWHVRTTGAQGSNLYGSVLQANCVIHVPESWIDPAAGATVSVQWLPWARPTS